jgi:hypothetical protein
LFLGEFEQQHGYEHEHEQLVIPSVARDLTVARNYSNICEGPRSEPDLCYLRGSE